MILEFSFENFLSFKDKNTFSMLGVRSFKEHEPDNVILFDKYKILKSSALYGNNASGKSNFYKGLALMKRLVQNSFRDALIEERNNQLPVDKFLLNYRTDTEPTHFEIIFIYKDLKYRYGFELDNEKIFNEWLYRTAIKKEVMLFERNINEYKINRASFKEGVNLESKTRDNVLFLSLVAQFNGEISNCVIEWFKNINFISGLQDVKYSIYTIEKLRSDSNFRKWVSLIIKTLEISNLTVEESDIEDDDFEKLSAKMKDKKFSKLIDAINEIKKESKKKIQISSWHNKFDENNFLIESIPFNFEGQESEGTKKFVYLLGPWYDTLKNGKILIVDEFDSRLHPQLSKRLVELFNRYNPNKSQLIYTSHDASMLDKDQLRRDQIWFVEKNQFGSSELYSLADFKAEKVRNTSSFYKNYLNGKYGAISTFDIDDRLIEVLYG